MVSDLVVRFFGTKYNSYFLQNLTILVQYVTVIKNATCLVKRGNTCVSRIRKSWRIAEKLEE